MRLEKNESNLTIWETGSKDNKIIYENNKDLTNYTRRNLSYIQLFLEENNEYIESNKVKGYLGKIIRCNSIPKKIPTGNYKVNSMLEYLKGTIDRYKENYGLDLDPDFQRGHVWSLEQRISYVEFILQDGESNPIFFNCPNWMNGKKEGNMVIVDGKQRLTSLLMFLNNEFTVFKNLDDDNIGYYADEFNVIPNDVIFIINDLPTRKQTLEWYLQMNKGNIAHTSEEIEKVEKLLRAEK